MWKSFEDVFLCIPNHDGGHEPDEDCRNEACVVAVRCLETLLSYVILVLLVLQLPLTPHHSLPLKLPRPPPEGLVWVFITGGIRWSCLLLAEGAALRSTA